MSLYKTFKRMQTGPVMIGVAVFGLIVFTITGAVTATFARNPMKGTDVRVTMPSGKEVKLSDEERVNAANAVTLFFDISRQDSLLRFAFSNQLQSLVPKLFQFQTVGIGERFGEKPAKGRDEVLSTMLVGALGRDKGIDVSPMEISEWVSNGFTSKDQYAAVCQFYRITPMSFEAALKEALLVKRTFEIALAETPVPTGDEIVKEWCSRNERFVFEVAAFKAADRKKAIESAAVADADLQKFFDELPPVQKERYRVPAQYVLDGLAVTDPGAKQNDAFEALIAAADVQDQDARSYYQIARIERFAKPASAPAPGAETQPSSAPASLPTYLAFDEVKDRAMRETRVARALEKVSKEAQEQKDAPGFDLKTFGEKYGLTYFSTGEPRPSMELGKVPTFGTPSLGVSLADLKEGTFLAGYRAAPGAIEIARVVKKAEAHMPDAASIRDKLQPEYVDKKAAEKAFDDAKTFQLAVTAATGDDRFATTAKAQSVETSTLPALAKSRREDSDFFGEPSDTPAHFLATLRGMDGRMPGMPADPFELKKGDVSPPLKDDASKVVYVVRVVERVEPTQKDMGPADYLGSRDTILRELRLKKCREMLSGESLSKSLKLKHPTES